MIKRLFAAAALLVWVAVAAAAPAHAVDWRLQHGKRYGAEQMQRALKCAGYTLGPYDVDGDWGSESVKAFVQFLKDTKRDKTYRGDEPLDVVLAMIKERQRGPCESAAATCHYTREINTILQSPTKDTAAFKEIFSRIRTLNYVIDEKNPAPGGLFPPGTADPENTAEDWENVKDELRAKWLDEEAGLRALFRKIIEGKKPNCMFCRHKPVLGIALKLGYANVTAIQLVQYRDLWGEAELLRRSIEDKTKIINEKKKQGKPDQRLEELRDREKTYLDTKLADIPGRFEPPQDAYQQFIKDVTSAVCVDGDSPYVTEQPHGP